MAALHSAYLLACSTANVEPISEFLDCLNKGERECNLASRSRPLTDLDVKCMAHALSIIPHSIRCLSLEENAFGLEGVSSLLEAFDANPNQIRELRLGRNKLRDACAITFANVLTNTGLGLKILDLSENGITKIGCGALATAIGGSASELVELSLHNNDLDKDAALTLSNCLSHSHRLKHLHLGYNQLKDAGATQLARCLPMAPVLSTLDLTANRIGPQGGQELARALMSETCRLQRLNLRANNLDDETLRMFVDIVRYNRHLTHLSLGHMTTSPDVADQLLGALKCNTKLLVLDVYGWSLDLAVCARTFEEIMTVNTTVRAITTDSCQPIFHVIDRHNKLRQEKGLHDIYIGPDDRLSAAAGEANSAGVGQSVSRASSVSQAAGPLQRYTASTSSANNHNSVVTNRTVFVQKSGGVHQQHVTSSKSTITTNEGEDTTGSNGISAVQSRNNKNQSGGPSSQLALTRHQNPSSLATSALGHRNPPTAADVDELNSHLLLVLSQLETKMNATDSFQRQSISNLELRVKALEDQMGRYNQREHQQESRIAEMSELINRLLVQQQTQNEKFVKMEEALKQTNAQLATTNAACAKAAALLFSRQNHQQGSEVQQRTQSASTNTITFDKNAHATQTESKNSLEVAREVAPVDLHRRLNATQVGHQKNATQSDATHASRELFSTLQTSEGRSRVVDSTLNFFGPHNQSGLNQDTPVLKAPMGPHFTTAKGTSTETVGNTTTMKSQSVTSNRGSSVVASPNPRPVASTSTFVIPTSTHTNFALTTIPVRAGQITPHRGPGTHRPASDFRDPQQDADEYYGNPTGRRPSISPPRLTNEMQLETPELLVRDEKVDRCFQPNEPSPIHENSMPAPDLQTSFQPPATADQIGSAKASSRPNDLPRRKTPRMIAAQADTFDV